MDVDILHPLTLLEWKKCRGPPVIVGNNACAVCLKDKVYVGGGWASTGRRDSARLYIYAPATDTWDMVDTPVYGFALTVYHSQLVLVGGREYVSENVEGRQSNELWTLCDDGQWQLNLPPLEASCSGASAVSHGDHLFVITSQHRVHVYNGQKWARTEDPPPLLRIKSSVVNGCCYVIELERGEVYCASLDSLIASCQPNETPQISSSVWKRLPNTPVGSCPIKFGNRLVAVGLSTICAFFPPTWVDVGNSPTLSQSPCAIVLPSNKLMVVAKEMAYMATLKVTDLKSRFNIEALNLLEATGIPLMSSLEAHTEIIQEKVGLFSLSEPDLNSLLSTWLSPNVEHRIPPTWESLLHVIHQLHLLDDLAEKIETHLRTMKVEHHRESFAEEEEEEADSETIYHLKQKIASHQKREKALQSEIMWLRMQLSPESPKEEDKIKQYHATADEPKTAQHSATATWDLAGVEVCGEMTVVVYSSHYQLITWEGFGLRLHVHEDSLPVGMEQCTLNIKASLAGQYEFPENLYLVSAVFWLRCEPTCMFTKPVTVEIQHCAKSENVDNFKMKFVRAVCSQTQLPYTFKRLGGDFSRHSSYGVIQVKGFSGLAVTQERSDQRQYCSKLFYLSNYFCGHRIDLVVTWDTEAHINKVNQHYERTGALAGPDQPVEFEKKEIRIDLPMEETKINDNWSIIPLIDPVVTKVEVDSYLPGKRIPHCELEAHPVGESATRLVYKVVLNGAKPPRNAFTLSYMPPKESVAKFASAAPLPPSHTSVPKLKDLQKELYSKVANVWEDIGIQLDIDEGHLRQIKSDNSGDSRACLREILRIWLSHIDPPPSWSAMADAIETLGYHDIAAYLRMQYL